MLEIQGDLNSGVPLNRLTYNENFFSGLLASARNCLNCICSRWALSFAAMDPHKRVRDFHDDFVLRFFSCIVP